jgi:RNA polymerase sigma-70 factor (ECF subfamily)
VFSEDAIPADEVERRPARTSLRDSSVPPPREPAPCDPAQLEPVPPDFRALFATHFDYVWNALRRLGVRESDLEDVAHDVFLAVFRKIERYDAARPLRPWLFGFAFRFASDYRERARHRFEVACDAAEWRDERPNALEHALQTEALTLAWRALETLELDRRAVFILHELDECPMPEVSRVLGIPLNTAYSRLRLARVELARAVARLRLKGGA